MKSIMTADVLLAYPNHKLPLKIDTDTADYQMGTVIKQNGVPVAYWSKKEVNALGRRTDLQPAAQRLCKQWPGSTPTINGASNEVMIRSTKYHNHHLVITDIVKQKNRCPRDRQ
jgi:hypothetical protein